MFHLGIVIDGTSLINSGQPHTSHLAPLTSNYAVFSMAKRTNDGGVEECKVKGFSHPNVLTTNASSIRLPLGFLDLNTRGAQSHKFRLICLE